MPRPKSFNQQDITRALKATVAAGLTISRLEIDKGKIVLFPGPPASEILAMGGDKNEWDDVK